MLFSALRPQQPLRFQRRMRMQRRRLYMTFILIVVVYGLVALRFDLLVVANGSSPTWSISTSRNGGTTAAPTVVVDLDYDQQNHPLNNDDEDIELTNLISQVLKQMTTTTTTTRDVRRRGSDSAGRRSGNNRNDNDKDATHNNWNRDGVIEFDIDKSSFLRHGQVDGQDNTYDLTGAVKITFTENNVQHEEHLYIDHLSFDGLFLDLEWTAAT